MQSKIVLAHTNKKKFIFLQFWDNSPRVFLVMMCAKNVYVFCVQ